MAGGRPLRIIPEAWHRSRSLAPSLLAYAKVSFYQMTPRRASGNGRWPATPYHRSRSLAPSLLSTEPCHDLLNNK